MTTHHITKVLNLLCTLSNSRLVKVQIYILRDFVAVPLLDFINSTAYKIPTQLCKIVKSLLPRKLAFAIKNMLYKLMTRINRCKSKCIHVKKLYLKKLKELLFVDDAI